MYFLKINEISLRNFRSFFDTSFSFGDGVNIVCGENGRGKTNLLESIYLLSGARSWRTGKRQEYIKWDMPRGDIKAGFASRGRDFKAEISYFLTSKSIASINGVKYTGTSELSKYMKCVLFSPEDIFIVKGAPALRRDFLNVSIAQLRPKYSLALEKYAAVLKSKSRVLQEGLEKPGLYELLEDYNRQLSFYGGEIIRFRASFIQLLQEEAGKVHRLISGERETLSLAYRTISSLENPMADKEEIKGIFYRHLSEREQAEKQSGKCLVGIQRDDLEINLNGNDSKAYASQGQSRSIALSLKFGVRELINRDIGEYPVLLLDDILSELDENRRRFVCTHALGGQTIITSCEKDNDFENPRIISI